jgi:uncharacterized protein
LNVLKAKLFKIDLVRCLPGCLLFLSLQAFGSVYNLDNIPNPKVIDQHSHVSNPDNIIGTATVRQLNHMLQALEDSTLTEVAVVLVESIGDENIELFATDLFAKWGIGKEKDNNGLLILFVEDQRAIRFETGYGIEGVLPDALASRIQHQSMFPYFKTGNYDEGFVKGIEHVVSVLGEEKFEEAKKEIAWGVVLPIIIAIYLIIILISFVWIASAIKKIKNNDLLPTNISKYKALRNEKKSILLMLNIGIPAIAFVLIILFVENPVFLLFLLGVPVVTFPANLYSKIMMWKIRRQPIPCNTCDGTMRILSEKKEDEYLSVSQQFEEQLHAVDYDVFVCKDCGNEAIFTLDKPSVYAECPSCKTKAFTLHKRTVMVAPTFIHGGTERLTYKCQFCGHEDHKNNNLPRISRGGHIAAGSAAGSIFSGRGGFGSGGGFSGGSFGGGMSGGGGATGRW